MGVNLEMMKILTRFIVLSVLFTLGSCAEQEPQTVDYSLYQISFSQPTLGNVAVTDLDNGKIEVNIELNPFSKGSYPAHLHFGGINTVGELAYRLNDVDGETGKSRTVLDNVELSDGTVLTYEKLLEMDGSIKVHYAQSRLKDAVVAYGNIGKNDNYFSNGITVCVGH